MILHGSQYELLRKLSSFPECQRVLPEQLSHRIQIFHDILKENLEKAHKQYERVYNLRSRPIQFQQGQNVFKRNMILSDKNKHLNAKLCPKFTKCRIRKVIGQSRYELEDENGKCLGVYHAQDIRA